MITANALDMREDNLKKIASILQKGAYGAGITALGVTVLGIIGGVLSNGLFAPLSALLMGGYSGNADEALLAVIFLALVHMALFLVLMVGVMARELWSVLGIILTIIINIGLLVGWRYLPALGFIGVAGYALYYMTQDIRAYRINPLMTKELRERMRGMRAFVVITVYLAMMSGFVILMYLILTQSTTSMAVTGTLGRNLFRSVIGVQLILTLFIAPSFTINAVSSEYERQTFDLLRITLLPYQSFVIGKLESALSYIFLLLLSSIPIQSIAFLFGGVSQVELLITFVVLTMPAVLLGTLGLYFAVLFQRTVTASIRAYLVGGGLILVFSSMILGILQGFRLIFDGIIGTSAPLQALLIYLEHFAQSINPILVLNHTQKLVSEGRGLFFYSESIFDAQSLTYVPLLSHWLVLVITYSTLSAILIVLSVRKLQANDHHGELTG